MTTGVQARSLWFPLVAPPAAWAVHELLGWFVGETSCGQLMPPAVRLAIAGLTVAALLVSVSGVALGLAQWRRRNGSANPMSETTSDRIDFMALGGLLVSVIFTLAILLAGLPAAFVGDCGRIR